MRPNPYNHFHLLCLFLIYGGALASQDFVYQKAYEQYFFRDQESRVSEFGGFDYVEPFIDGMAIVKNEGKYAFLNEFGEYLTNLEFDTIARRADYFFVKQNEQYGILDLDLITLVPIEFDWIYHYDLERGAVIKEGEDLVYWKDGQIDTLIADNIVFNHPDRIAILETCLGVENGFHCSLIEISRQCALKMNYPREAREKGIEGIVYLEVTIDDIGKIRDFQILAGIGHGCEEEVLIAFEDFIGFWIPATINNKPIWSTVVAPFKFQLW